MFIEMAYQVEIHMDSMCVWDSWGIVPCKTFLIAKHWLQTILQMIELDLEVTWN